MAKIFEGAIKLASTIQQTGAQPLDDRVVVAKVSDLYDSFGTAIYNGMLVAVAETGDVYMLKDKTKVGEAAGWKLIGGDTAAGLEGLTGRVKTLEGKHAEGKTVAQEVTYGIEGLDVANNTSDAVKGVTVTVNETDGKVTQPVISIADGTLTGVATDGNLVTGTVVKTYVDDKVKTITDNAGALSGRVDKLEGTVGDKTKGLVKDMTAAKSAIDTINGDVNTLGSFAKGDAETLTAAKKHTDDSIAALDVTGNTSEAVKGVTVTVDETDGKVIKPVVSIADGTVGGESDANLVTGSTVKTYVDGKVKTITDNANALSGRVDKLDATHTKKGDGSFNTVAEEVTTGIAGIAETSKANTAGSDVVVTVTTKSGSVSSVAVDSSVLNKAVTDGDDAVKTELRGDAATDYNTLGKLEDKIQEEASRADAAEKVNAGAISDEADRAKKAEKANADAIATINGTGVGSFAKGDADTLTSAKSYADEQIAKSVTSVYKVKGTKATYADLPSEGNVEGDVWNVTAAHEYTPAGTNYVWVADGETGHWDPLGGTIDLSPYAKSADVATTYATKTELSTTKSDLIGDATADYNTLGKLETKIKANTDSITMITGTGDGSITKAVGDAKSALIGTDGDAATKDTIYGAKQAVKDLEAQIEKDAVTLTIPDTDPYITASKDATTNKYTISSKLDTDGKTPLVDAKINTKLTEKINSLSGGGIAEANGISIKVTEEKGIIGIPEVSVIPGDVNKDDNHVVTGGAVYTALTNALTWNDIPATA